MKNCRLGQIDCEDCKATVCDYGFYAYGLHDIVEDVIKGVCLLTLYPEVRI